MRTSLQMILLVGLVECAVGRDVGKEDSNRRLVRKRMRLLLKELLQLCQRFIAFLVGRTPRLLRLRKRIRLVVERKLEIRGLAREIHQSMINAVSNACELLQVFLAQHSQLSMIQIVSEDPRFLCFIQ